MFYYTDSQYVILVKKLSHLYVVTLSFQNSHLLQVNVLVNIKYSSSSWFIPLERKKSSSLFKST